MTDTGARRRRLPATTQIEHLDVVVLGSSLHHDQRAGHRAARRGRSNSEIFRLLARRLGSPIRARRERRADARGAARRRPSGHRPAGLRERGFAKVDCGQGTTPRRGGSVRRPASSGCAAAAGRRRLRSLPFFAKKSWMSARERYPLALLTPKTHLFLNSTFANGRRRTPRSPSRSSSSTPPTPRLAVSPTARCALSNAAGAARAVVSTTPAPAWR